MTHPLSRRRFLRGLGGAAVALPLLAPELSPPTARAAEAGPPKRLIVFFHPNGVIPEAWFPTRGPSEREDDFSLAPGHEALAAHKSKIVLFKNVDMTVGGAGPGGMHQQGMGGLLTGRPLNRGAFRGNAGRLAGWGSGISLDQKIARELGAQTPLASLELGVRANHHAGSEVMTRLSYLGADQPLPPQDDPLEVFKLLFSDAETPKGALDEVSARRASVLDAVRDQYAAVRSRAGYEDRQRLDYHMQLVRDLERRLSIAGGEGASCRLPDRPADRDPDSKETMEAIARAQIDMLVMAMACDQTRVATLQFSNAWNKIVFPWIDSLVEGHTLSHAGPSNAAYNSQWNARNAWYAEQLAYLLDRLDAIPEGDGTLLDHCVVLWTSEVARGNTHSWKDMPILLAGSAGQSWKTNRFIEYASTRSMNDLYVTLLQSFGLPDQTFGDPDFCDGPIPSLV